MPSSLNFLLSLLLLLFSTITNLTLATTKTCQTTVSCHKDTESFDIRFPFTTIDTPLCGYPGFELKCDSSLSKTLISLPSGDFSVQTINYMAQSVTLADPYNCLESRFLRQNFSLQDTNFRAKNSANYTFLGCSETALERYRGQAFEAVQCLGGDGREIVAILTALFESAPEFCDVIGSVFVPIVSSMRWRDIRLSSEVELEWDKPGCSECEHSGGECRFTTELGLEIGCFNLPKPGLSKASKSALVIILGLVILGFLCFSPRIKRHAIHIRNVTRVNLARQNPNRPTEPTHISQPHQTNNNNENNVALPGLDKMVIDTYPKSLVGESRRLLNSNYNVCPICLSEYRAKDILRTLPDCFHYFHADCVDEWLKMNASCPLCRNSPLKSPYGQAV